MYYWNAVGNTTVKSAKIDKLDIFIWKLFQESFSCVIDQKSFFIIESYTVVYLLAESYKGYGKTLRNIQLCAIPIAFMGNYL